MSFIRSYLRCRTQTPTYINHLRPFVRPITLAAPKKFLTKLALSVAWMSYNITLSDYTQPYTARSQPSICLAPRGKEKKKKKKRRKTCYFLQRDQLEIFTSPNPEWTEAKPEHVEPTLHRFFFFFLLVLTPCQGLIHVAVQIFNIYSQEWAHHTGARTNWIMESQV